MSCNEEVINEGPDYTFTGEVIDDAVVTLTMYLSESVVESNRNKESRPDHDDSVIRWILFEEDVIALRNFLERVHFTGESNGD